jgi:hypothetical protein
MPQPTRRRFAPILEPLEDRSLLSGVNVAAGDINGDGRADLAVLRRGGGGSGGSVYLETHLGDGRGNLVPTSSTLLPGVSAGAEPRIAVGDLNGDSRPDVVLAVPDGASTVQVSVLLNNGKGGFDPPDVRRSWSIPHVFETRGGIWGDPHVSEGAGNLGVADLDRDGRLDVAIVTPAGAGAIQVSLLRGDGQGNLADTRKAFSIPHVFESKGPYGRLVGIGDLDGDGRADLVAQQGGTFLYLTLLPEGEEPGQQRINKIEALAVKFPKGNATSLLGDVDGDGDLDLVAVVNGTIHVGLNGGGGSGGTLKFDWRQLDGPFRAPTHSLLLGDVDGDGDLDLFGVSTGGRHEIAMNSIRNLKA